MSESDVAGLYFCAAVKWMWFWLVGFGGRTIDRGL